MHSFVHDEEELPSVDHVIYSHYVILDNLVMDQKYFFKVGDVTNIQTQEY